MATAVDGAHSIFRAKAGLEQASPLSTPPSGHSRSERLNGRRAGPKSPRKATPPNPRLLSVRDAARYLACSEWVMRSLIDKGELLHLKVGKKLRVDRGDLDRFIDSHRTTAGSAKS